MAISNILLEGVRKANGGQIYQISGYCDSLHDLGEALPELSPFNSGWMIWGHSGALQIPTALPSPWLGPLDCSVGVTFLPCKMRLDQSSLEFVKQPDLTVAPEPPFREPGVSSPMRAAAQVSPTNPTMSGKEMHLGYFEPPSCGLACLQQYVQLASGGDRHLLPRWTSAWAGFVQEIGRGADDIRETTTCRFLFVDKMYKEKPPFTCCPW